MSNLDIIYQQYPAAKYSVTALNIEGWTKVFILEGNKPTAIEIGLGKSLDQAVEDLLDKLTAPEVK